jgi:hypothetical protein
VRKRTSKSIAMLPKLRFLHLLLYAIICSCNFPYPIIGKGTQGTITMPPALFKPSAMTMRKEL